MALAMERHLSAASNAPARRAEAPPSEVARALFAEHLDIEAIRRTLGQPRGRGDESRDPPADATPPPPAPASRAAPRIAVSSRTPPAARSRLGLVAMLAVGTAGLMTGGLLALGGPAGNLPVPSRAIEPALGPAPEPAPSVPARVVETPPASVDLVATPPGSPALLAVAPGIAIGSEGDGAAEIDAAAREVVAGLDLAASARTLPARAALGYPAPPPARALPSEQMARPMPPRRPAGPNVRPTIAAAPGTRPAAPAEVAPPPVAVPRAATILASTAAAPTNRISASAVSPAGARVVIHYDRRAWGARPAALADGLRAAGFGRVEWRAVDLGISTSQTRFFRAADAGLSGRVARVLAAGGRPVAQRDFTHFSPPPSPGTIEVWLAR